ncbi:MAG: Calx-beta domain-containing protein [Acidimicrobiales bacterium]
MSGRKLAAIAAVVVAAVVVLVIVWPSSGGGDDEDGPTFVIAGVERRDLSEEITVRGVVRRDELIRITSPIEGQVSSVLVDDGDTIESGDVIFALDGRAAVAVDGEFSFFRQLDVGSQGPDVAQLERILVDQGYQVGLVDELFTEETRAGLAQWQRDRGYGGATPEPDENVTIALQSNPAGYAVGARNAVSVRLGPTVPPRRGDSRRDEAGSAGADGSGGRPDSGDGTGDDADNGDDEGALPPPSTGAVSTDAVDGDVVLAAFAQPAAPEPVVRPVIEVTVTPGRVSEGEEATFTFTSDIAMPTDTIVDYTVGGDATAGDDYADVLNGTILFPAGRTSVDLVVRTFADEDIERRETLTITVGTPIIANEGENYAVGPRKEATLTIVGPDDERPRLEIIAAQGTVNEGGQLTFTIEADRASNTDRTVIVAVGGTASAGSDYNTVPRDVVLPAGATTVNLTIQTLDDLLVETDETLVVSLVPRRRYDVGARSSASTTLLSDDLPEIVLRGGGRVGEGERTSFTVVADQAPIVDTSINYAVGGSATPGRDYEELAGTVILPAGQRSVTVEIVTIDDDVVFRPGDMVVADWPARIGTVSVDEGEFILLGQQVLTLTEPDFSITMLLNPTDRGRLEPNLAVTVELQASDQEAVAGFIASIDETATVDAATGAETYEGVVETVTDLEAVDGASVNIDVTLDQRRDVITVPVASVLQDGAGNDVVRVVLDDGTTRQVEVQVGLSEGAFVEIESGLDGDELVLVET